MLWCHRIPQGLFDPLTLAHISGMCLSVSLEGWLISVFISKFVSILHLKIKQWNVTAAKCVSSLSENSVSAESEVCNLSFWLLFIPQGLLQTKQASWSPRWKCIGRSCRTWTISAGRSSPCRRPIWCTCTTPSVWRRSSRKPMQHEPSWKPTKDR